jgi:hypothetical protein
MILRHKRRQISFLHVYHHSSMLLLTDSCYHLYPWPAISVYLATNSFYAFSMETTFLGIELLSRNKDTKLHVRMNWLLSKQKWPAMDTDGNKNL